MTRRDLQRMQGDQKGRGNGKGFDHSAPIGADHRCRRSDISTKRRDLAQRERRDEAASGSRQMIWSVAETIAYLSSSFELVAGDLIYSGTPENVGAVVKGDIVEAHVDGLPDLRIRIV